MFDNVGNKIKMFCKIVTVILMVASVFSGMRIWWLGSKGLDAHWFLVVLYGLLNIVLGVFGSLVLGWFGYAIGSACDNSEKNLKELDALREDVRLLRKSL